jgi:hypothetical protein
MILNLRKLYGSNSSHACAVVQGSIRERRKCIERTRITRDPSWTHVAATLLKKFARKPARLHQDCYPKAGGPPARRCRHC